MPWLGHAPDAPDSHRLWADDDSDYERALRASGWLHEVPAPGSDEVDVLGDEPPAPPVLEEAAVEQPAEEPVAPRPLSRKSRAS